MAQMKYKLRPASISIMRPASMPVRPTTTERILYYTGRPTRVARSTTALPPWTEWSGEQERGVTIYLCSHHVLSGRTTSSDRRLSRATLTSRPRSSALRVLGNCEIAVSTPSPASSPVETVWRRAARNPQRPHIAFVNKFDRVGADFFRHRHDEGSASPPRRGRTTNSHGLRSNFLGVSST